MFDFVISKDQQRRSPTRIFASWVVSCLVHVCFLLMLIQYPQLLRGGMYHHFRPLSAIANLFGTTPPDDDSNWRTVTVLRTPMIEPSAATLKKYLKDWNQEGPESPPIRIRWGNEQKKALQNLPPMPRIIQKPNAPDRLPPPNETPATGASAGNSTESKPGSSSSTVPQADQNAGKNGTVNLPPPGPAAEPEVAGNMAPSSIPQGIKPQPVTPQPKDSVKIFENEQKAIRSSDSGFFGVPEGFPLGEYANLIKERIKRKWFIPSNLKNSQGHTTIIFYIGRDGHYSNARIEASASSGNTSLDLAALKAIIDSNPFPPLPKGFPGDRIGAKFVLSYNEPLP
jgi:TonB family protein